MAKLSDIFGRKGIPAGADKLTGRPRNGNGNDHISIESPSDVGSRMGEENEALRNLLSDTGRKIGELDELKEAFDKLVAPFNSTLRALEQEKSQTLSLSGMLAEARAAYETLRTEFYQIESKATALEAEAERLREDLELSRESNRGLESARIELTDDLNARHAQITELERQLAQETTQRRTLAKPAARCRTNSTPPKSASSNSKANSPPRARSSRCWKTRSARCRSRSIRRSTRPRG